MLNRTISPSLGQFLLFCIQCCNFQQWLNAIVGNKCSASEFGKSACMRKGLLFSLHFSLTLAFLHLFHIRVIYEQSLEKIHVWQAYGNWRERTVQRKRNYAVELTEQMHGEKVHLKLCSQAIYHLIGPCVKEGFIPTEFSFCFIYWD